jgi:hypothetical protein
VIGDKIPDPPNFTDEEWRRCRDSGDFAPILFEWYKFVSALCNFFACIQPNSPAVRKMDYTQYAVLVGLLNRCSRLMLSNVALSHEGLFGETTALIDRCIFDSCVKVAWLCQNEAADNFDRFFADGLRTELELKAEISANIQSRGGAVLTIERRMLESIERTIRSSGLDDAAVLEAKRLPDLATMIASVGGDRLMYIVGQRIGSHRIHGTWTSLRMHYLEEADQGEGMLRPRDHNCSTHINQYVFVPWAVLTALKSFVCFIFADAKDAEPVQGLIDSVVGEINAVNREVVGQDFERVNDV